MNGRGGTAAQPAAGNKFNVNGIIRMRDQNAGAQFDLHDSTHDAVSRRDQSRSSARHSGSLMMALVPYRSDRYLAVWSI